MFLTQVNDRAGFPASSRAAIVARRMESRLTGTMVAAGFATLMLIGVALTANDIHASGDALKARVWQSVSNVLCSSHLDAITPIGSSCGAVGR
ncbi:hypothetical protein EOI86_07010 [Hwanghaeella grinnelliae]|uniref:Uncharacterized protein n=1 Tax=Hwanghaeella grinnelliae TaxID=2500179 RepID=A0A3S2WUT5_9PROT|nr:hypothetical protein [Hwanghaeella grinnelliae]RVU39002.1 hypothetical protein EOI86_07010 [Hwanghaeella grinnelliae]